MRRRSSSNERPQAPTAPRRRSGSNGEVPPAELNPSSALSKVLRQRELAQASRASKSVAPAGRRVRPVAAQVIRDTSAVSRQPQSRPAASTAVTVSSSGLHPLCNGEANATLRTYEERTLGSFDRIVPLLKRLSALQHEADFVAQAQRLALAELGHELPLPVLEQAWTSQLDMRTLFAWSVFEAYEQTSLSFFNDDPLAAQAGSGDAEAFNAFLLDCGFHLLDITPCACPSARCGAAPTPAPCSTWRTRWTAG